jgi:hypothetical protein
VRGLLLASLALLSGLWSAPPAAQPRPTPTPYVQPTLLPPPTPVCPNVVPNRLTLYERGRVSYDDPEPLNIRQGPSTNFDIDGEIPVGGVFFVLDGPECSPTYTWLYVRYEAVEGWIAEGTIGGVYYVEPYPPAG